MSGHDESFAPPPEVEAKPSPYPPTPAPPSFGRTPRATKPSDELQADDVPPGVRVLAGPPVAADGEESMTVPPHSRTGAPASDAQTTMTAPPPPDTAPVSGPPPGSPRAAATRQAGAAPRGDTVPDIPDPRGETPRRHMPPPSAQNVSAQNVSEKPSEKRTTALVWPGTDAGEPTESAGPALTPDAILPPGTSPQAQPEAPDDLNATSTGPIPRLGPTGGYPGGPPGPVPPSGSSGARRTLLVGAGAISALLLAGGAALALTTFSGGSPKTPQIRRSQAPAAPAVAQPTPKPHKPPKAKPKPKPKPKPEPVDIRDEKKDLRPLTIGEIFPARKITLAGHTFVRAKAIINDSCMWTAYGPFAQGLTWQHCRRVVRATFVSGNRKIAVTTGIAAMPTDAAAKAAMTAQDPAHYKWFRGMKAPGAAKIDQPGGIGAGTTRGRYIIYAYVAYADGHKPAANDQTLKTVGAAFRDSTARPIERRAQN